MKKVIFSKPDMDTCLTAVILNVDRGVSVTVAPGGASPEDLADPSVCCIEAGGSGQVHLNNFDHHDPVLAFDPACRQAFGQIKSDEITDDTAMERLVDYVCRVDLGQAIDPPPEFPSLSNVFSGMLMTEKGLSNQFVKGCNLMRLMLEEKLSPFESVPEKAEWEPYIKAKLANQAQLEKDLRTFVRHLTRQGRVVGYMQTTAIGGSWYMYEQGCDVAVLFNPAFGDPPVAKYTISGNNVAVADLLEPLNRLENGWGGRVEIIGSPRSGSGLSPEIVLKEVVKWL